VVLPGYRWERLEFPIATLYSRGWPGEYEIQRLYHENGILLALFGRGGLTTETPEPLGISTLCLENGIFMALSGSGTMERV